MAKTYEQIRAIGTFIKNTTTAKSVTNQMVGENIEDIADKMISLDNGLKGYFTTIDSLLLAFPNPQIGWTAWVGAAYPGTVYDVVSGAWHNTTVVPPAEEVNLADYINKNDLAQDIGESETDVMSQKAVTDELIQIESDLNDFQDQRVDQKVDIQSGSYRLISYASGDTIDRSSEKDYKSVILNVVYGQKIKYTLKAGPSVAIIAALDLGGNYLIGSSIQGTGALKRDTLIIDDINIYSVIITTDVASLDATKCYAIIASNDSNYSNDHLSINNFRFNSVGSKTNGIITLMGGGFNERAYINIATQSSFFYTSTRFYSTSDNFEFLVGKYWNAYAGFASIGSANKLRIFITSAAGDDMQPDYEYDIPFDIVKNIRYCIIIRKYTDNTAHLNVKIISEFGDVYEMPELSGIIPFYGYPCVTSFGECIVEDYNYNINELDASTIKAAIWGHSFVEGDTIDTNRSNTFASLLINFLNGNAINWGWGGDTIVNLLEQRFGYELYISRNAKYALIVEGINDISDSNVLIDRLNRIALMCIRMNMIPILFTVSPRYDESLNQRFIELNSWIRTSGYKYVDMYKVFFGIDGLLRRDLYLSDNVHPSIEGHRLIFNRILFDCPFMS